MTQATLEMRAVEKRYPNGMLAVKGVTVSVGKGELCVFVGPSGCGKSTMLRMVAGLESVTEGDVVLDGRVVNTEEPAERNIAMVFQNYALYPHMTVRGNLAYGLKNRKMPKDEIEKRVREASELLQIDEYLDRKPSQLSGGQRQRVAMGRAIVRSPSIFLFDEPLSNLDAKLRNQMRLEIRKLQQRLGTAMIYVTHDQVEAMTLADRIVVINEGRIEQIGTPSEIYNSPASTFVASFIGAPPMNMLAGEANGSTLAIAGVDLGVEAPANGAVTLGIRPERATISAQKPSGLALPAEVDVIEELGAHRLVHVLIGPERVPFTAQQDTIEDLANGTVWLAFAREDMVFFDGESGKRL